MNEHDERRQQYQAELDALNAKCAECIQQNGTVDYQRCEQHCYIGFRIRTLEVQNSDLTGFTHEAWKKN